MASTYSTDVILFQADVRVLEPGAAVEREIAGGEAHSYHISLVAHQFLSVVVNQQGVDVVLRMFGPDAQQMAEIDNAIGLERSERLSVVAEAAGNYRLEVRPARKEAARGRYDMRVEELRAATPQDRSLVAAEAVFTQARRLRRQATEESLRAAVIKYEEALQLYRAAGERKREVSTLNAIGEIYRMSGNSRKALNLFLEALSVSRSVNDRPVQITTLISLGGGVYYDLGEPEKALEHLGEALKLSITAGDHQAQALVHNNIGVIYVVIDELQQALEHFRRATAIHQAGENNRGKSMTLINVGGTYHALGEYEKALAGYQEALSIVRAAGYSPAIASALQNIGGTYIAMGEPSKALEALNEALPLARSAGHRTLEAQVLGSLGAAYYRLGDWRRALEMYRQALIINKEVGLRMEEATALYEIGTVYASMGEKLKALEYLNQALPLSQSIKSHTIEALTLYEIARVEGNLGRLDEARAHIEAALGITESIRAKVASHDLRATYLASKRKIYELHIDTLMRLHQRHPSKGYDAAAFEASEKARARSLIEMLAEARIDIRQGVEPQLLERERNLLRRINAKAERHGQLLGNKKTADQAAAARREIDSLLTEFQEVQAQIRSTSPRYAALTQPQPLSLKEIQQALDPDTLLLEYSLGEEHSFLWAVTKTSLTSYLLPKRAEIEASARQVYDLLTARNKRVPGETPQQRLARVAEASGEYSKAAARLSQMLLAPVTAQLEKKRLLIVGDGALQYIPFGALPAPMLVVGGQGSGASVDRKIASGFRRPITQHRSPTPDHRPLIVDHEIVCLPSASVLAALRQEFAARKTAPKTVAVLADPVFTSDDQRVIASQAKVKRAPQNQPADSADPAVERSAKESGVISLNRLRFSRQEADAIAALFSGTKSLKAVDFKANRETATSAEISEHRIVHFATHVLLNSRHPELSGVVLSLVDEQGRARDGFLRLHEIYNLKLAADLVVLSACQTALGKEIKGEGLIGLTRGFMYAGAPRVVASLWSVDDRATAELMKRFYQGMLGKGLAPAAALRAAQVQMWKEKGWEDPFYWGGFVLQGEWK